MYILAGIIIFRGLAIVSSGKSDLVKRYSTALFELAKESKQMDIVEKDMESLVKLINENDELKETLENPIVARKEKKAAVTAISKKAKFNDITCNFICLVAERGRLYALLKMIDAFFDLLSEHRGEVKVYVTSAKKLTEKQNKSLKDILEKEIKGNIIIDAIVNPELLGGLIVKIGYRMVDSSLRSKLQRLQTVMKGVC